MNENARWPFTTAGIDDDLFIRGEVPMTKSEVRAITLSKLKPEEGHYFLDVGAGTGSVSVECGLKGCYVTAVERKGEGIQLIEENAKAFGVEHIEIIEGVAPMAFPENALYDRIFIGGTGGKVEGIFKYLETHLKPGGIIVANTITIENTSKFMSVMKHYKYDQIEAVQVNVSRSRAVGSVHMMMAENPITIISAVKSEEMEGKKNGKSTVHRSRTWRPRTNNA